MNSDYLIVSKKILPAYLEKVIEARNLLESRQAKTVTEATEKLGISRNTYYKYKDFVFEPTDNSLSHRAVLSLILKHVSGALSAVINVLSECGTSILTISQSVPVSGKANVLISLDISHINCNFDQLLSRLKALSAVTDIELNGIE
ncbi:MAG: ACT domain-containing protein [Firmicutes bacterium]|nr:ACT domain-containing protein [Bacillota bacterium]